MQQSRFIRNILLGIENLFLHKLRSFLTMLGLIFGVGSVVAMLAVGEGASKEALRQIQKLGSNNIIITSVKSIEETAATQSSIMSIYGLTYLDHERISESFRHVQQVAPAKLIRKESRVGSNVLELRVVGTTQGWFELVPRQVLAGRVFNKTDLQKTAAVVVLTEYGARKLLATKNTLGQTVRIGGIILRSLES
jgi:putative ABC transport system permease protein